MNLILEIGCEELPTSAIQTAIEFLPQQLTHDLQLARLDFESIESFGTPRRLLLLVSNLGATSKDSDTEILGPKIEVAFDSQGKLTPAGFGFLKARHIDPKNAYQKTGPKGTVLAAQLREKGLPALEILSELLPKLILQIPFQKTMRWEKSKIKFARPIRWILALLDKQVIPFEIAGVRSSHKTCGHRFMAPNFHNVTQKTYFQFLTKNYILLDREKRKELILKQAHKLAKSIGGHLNEDPDLLNTVANLVEYPWPILGSFDVEYLKIPQEILICEMREHQKYFSIFDAQKNLMPYFVIVSGVKPVNKKELAAGNARVLKARFADGAFYYEEDLKRKLSDYVSEPPQNLMDWAKKLAVTLDFKDTKNLERAAYLSKADLVTGVVGQFPELQGVMGAIYAQKSGENHDVAQAIREQYKIPNTQLGAILSLADRFNTLVSRPLPKGSADPYGLRRAAMGLARIILARGFKFHLNELIANKEILDFVMTRARSIFLEKHSVLVVDATQEAAHYDLCAWQARILALEAFDYAAVSAVFKRVSHIASPFAQEGSVEILKESSEIALQRAIKAVEVSDDYSRMLEQLAQLKPILDTFFEDIMVMVDDLKLRQARLALLSEVQNKAAYVADFSKLTQ